MLGAGVVGGISNYFSAKAEAKSLKKQTDQVRKQYEDSARSSRSMGMKTDQASKASYQWASSMIRKFSGNPQAVTALNEGLNSRLSDYGQRSDKFYNDAATMLASRPAAITNGQVRSAARQGAFSGLMSGIGLVNQIAGTDSGSAGLDKFEDGVKSLFAHKGEAGSGTINPPALQSTFNWKLPDQYSNNGFSPKPSWVDSVAGNMPKWQIPKRGW